MSYTSNLFIILASITLSSSAHLFLKKGVMTLNLIGLKSENQLFDTALFVVSSPWIVLGMFMHVGALLIWLWALSRVDITFAYPFLSLGFVLVSLMAYFWIGESLPFERILGMIIITIGIIVIGIAG